MVMRGRAEITTTLRRMMSNFRSVLMSFQCPIVEVEQDVAAGRTYATERCVLANGQGLLAISTYFERFVSQGNRWRFSWRLFQLHYIGPPDLSGSFVENPDYGPPTGMPARDCPTINYSGFGS